MIKREKVFAKWVDKFIVLNKFACEMYKKNIPEEKLYIIYDGVDLNDLLNSKAGCFRKEFNLDSCPIVGLVGRIVEGKGHKEFILSAKEILKIEPSVKFVIVGDSKGESDGYFQAVKRLVRENKLNENFIFTGWRDDVRNIILDLDILVQASTTFPEGLPNILLEAMALKKPIVATNIPGASEIVEDGKTGFLVPPGDTDAISSKIIYLLNHPDVGRVMGEKGLEKAEEKFDIKANVEKIEGLIYEKDKNFKS